MPKPIELEYYKSPMPRRTFAFFFDVICMVLLTLGAFVGLRSAVENSPNYTSAFETYIRLSVDSKLYVYAETEDNLVQMDTYAEVTFKNDYASQVNFCEARLKTYYVDDPLGIFEAQGDAIYLAEKVGDDCIKQDDGTPYFALDSLGTPQPIVENKDLMGFYESAVISGIEYLNRSEEYIRAKQTLSKTVNFFLIPGAIAIAFTVFEFLVPLAFFRRGWQTLGMAVFHQSLITRDAISPKFNRFLCRFLWMLVIEVLLSLVTFGIPLFINVGMAFLRKDGQALHDYMTGVYMVDSTDQSVYKSKEEYLELERKAAQTEARPYLSSWKGDHIDENEPTKDGKKGTSSIEETPENPYNDVTKDTQESSRNGNSH